MKALKSILIWGLIAALGAAGFAVMALNSGESINAIWLLTAAVSVYAIAYRFYSRFIANKVFQLDDKRKTPSEIHNDGKDYVPTNKWVLFGHHFAAIAGAGPLVGPILAAQMGYLPGTLWIVVGVVLAGAVQDFIILFGSMRRNGKSLGEMIKDEMGRVTGIISMIGILGIMVILLAVLALVVVKALVGSPWGMFTIAATIPIAIFMGIYMRYIRPGRVGEASLIGIVLLLISLFFGQTVAENPTLAAMFTFKGETIAIMMIIYGFIASVLPVWLLLAPRDYLSTFLKIGTILGLALGIIIVAPNLEMAGVTKFIDGTGPVFAGNLFPFLFITIACGSVSGFHALVSSGTTPKMIERESHARPIGYGAMLTESFVAVMAMIAACVLTPGVYFAINSPPALIGTDVVQAASTVSSWGFTITPDDLKALANDVGEQTILSRTGGAPTLAIGMAVIFSKVIGGKALMAFWYHFAILFEALFILTTIDAGTRVGRFMIQDLIGTAYKPFARTDALIPNIIATALCVTFWGYFLYQGVIDPLGGINTLWPLFGIANQMLAAIALLLGTTILFKMGKKAYVWVTLLPTTWLLIVTLTAGWQKLFHENPKIGFLAHANIFKEAYNDGKVLAPATSPAQMKQILVNDYLDATLCVIFIAVVITVLISAIRIWIKVITNHKLPLHETTPVPRDGGDFTNYA
ncbi:carbon starvation CstA family protein [Gottfriedia solisilvae]|uniref:carbon starvation CstA family protein n=1 Tax=Gottfriedia solisilvae TaxID=1516104 RepID=UPI000B42F6A8|nr:carbon starvation CstA family protein [Gottfriedia solisilvae]